jgi:hypothetical protein
MPLTIRKLIKGQDGNWHLSETPTPYRPATPKRFKKQRVDAEWLAKGLDKDSKKGIKAKLKDRKKDAKAKAKAETVDRAERDAAATRERNMTLNKSDMVTIAKSVINGQQQGLTSRDFYRELVERSVKARTAHQTPEQAFAKYCETEDGRLLMAAMRKAKPVPWDQPDEDDEEQQTEDKLRRSAALEKRGGALGLNEMYRGAGLAKVDGDGVDSLKAYDRLLRVAADKRTPGETLASAFARTYADPAYRNLVHQEKAESAATIAKWGGTRV